jgi:hypothetical protein
MGEMTAEQVRAAKVAAMGNELGELCYDLYREVAWLHVKWQEYRELFGTSRERIELLNRAAPAFFNFLQAVLFEDVLLHITRLTDPPQSRKDKDNLTLRRLSALLPAPGLKLRVDQLLDQAKQKSEFARDRRNRWIAHRDLLTVRNQSPQPLAKASREAVEQALGAIRDVMNEVESHYENRRVAYEQSIEPLGGAAALVARLDRSRRKR